MDSLNRIFKEPGFIKKEEYTEEECLRYFSALEEGLYQVPGVGWLVRIEASGAFLIELQDQETLLEVQRESPALRTVKQLPHEIANLFGISEMPPLQLAIEMIHQRILDLLKRNPSALKGYHPEMN